MKSQPPLQSEDLPAQGDLMALVAHELRNPLHALTLQLGVAEAALQADNRAQAQVLLAKARATLARYTDRATVLLDLVLLQDGAFNLQPRAIDLTLLLRGLAESIGEEARQRGAVLRLDLPERCLLNLDPVPVEQIVDNLVLNALKHSGCSGVWIALDCDASWVTVRVRDDGCGIVAEDRDRVFGKYGVASATPRGRGSGLGLWIVRTLCAALGGSVDFTSAPGQGTEFTVRLPTARQPEGIET